MSLSKNQYQVSQDIGNSLLQSWPEDYIPGGNKNGRWLTLNSGPDAGKKLFFYDVCLGQDEPQCTLFFVHGNPESSYTYRKIIAELEQKTLAFSVRVVAMDHIGFGLSDQASFEMVDQHHAQNLLQLIEVLDLKKVCLCLHDWGGAISIGAFIDQAERVSAMVLMNTTVFPVLRDGPWVYDNFPLPGFLSWNRVAHWLPNSLWPWLCAMVVCRPAFSKTTFVKELLGFFWRSLSGNLEEKEKLYRDMFCSEMNSRSSRRNACQTHVWGHGYQYQDNALGLQNNIEFYKNIQKKIEAAWSDRIPVMGFFGQWDVLAKESVLNQWQEHLPQLQDNIHLYPQRGHFVEEWEYRDIAAGIEQLLSELVQAS